MRWHVERRQSTSYVSQTFIISIFSQIFIFCPKIWFEMNLLPFILVNNCIHTKLQWNGWCSWYLISVGEEEYARLGPRLRKLGRDICWCLPLGSTLKGKDWWTRKKYVCTVSAWCFWHDVVYSPEVGRRASEMKTKPEMLIIMLLTHTLLRFWNDYSVFQILLIDNAPVCEAKCFFNGLFCVLEDLP